MEKIQQCKQNKNVKKKNKKQWGNSGLHHAVVLAEISFTTNETELDFYQYRVNIRIVS